MKRIFVWICLLFPFTASLSLADLVITEKTETTGPSAETVTKTIIKIKGTKRRTETYREEAPPIVMIHDNVSGEQFTLHLESKTYNFTSASAAKQGDEVRQEMVKQMRASGAKIENLPDPDDKTEIRATGRHEVISGHSCEEYVWEKEGKKITTWFARDFPNVKQIREQIKKSEYPNLRAITKGVAPDTSAVPGVEMRYEYDQKSFTGPGINHVTKTVISIEERPVDDSEFQPPKDFTERK